MVYLDERLEEAFVENEIKKQHREAVRSYLDSLKHHDEGTYKHSIRVGLLSNRIGKFFGYTQPQKRPLLYAGLLHDIGKLVVSGEILNKTEDFTDEDYEKIKIHPDAGHEILEGKYEYTAEIIVRHHCYQRNPYPEELPQPRVTFGRVAEERIGRYSRLLSIADFYDAAISRDNSKFGKPDPHDRQVMLRLFKEHKPDSLGAAEMLLNKNVLDASLYEIG